jgi:hypothetical protein
MAGSSWRRSVLEASRFQPSRLSGFTTAQAGDEDIKVIISERSSSGQPVQKPIPSLKGKSLPDLKDLGVQMADAHDKALLVCLLDIDQRPSRKCLSDLVKKTQALSAKGITTVVVQTSKADLKQHEDWLKTNQVAFPIHAVEGDFEAKKAAWGVKALPWLILTDKDHRVVAEGFAVSKLDSILGR